MLHKVDDDIPCRVALQLCEDQANPATSIEDQGQNEAIFMKKLTRQS